MTEPRRYTDEVLTAMRERQMLPPETAPDPPVTGLVRYHIAVEKTVLNGQASPPHVATILRGLADSLDPPTSQGVTA